VKVIEILLIFMLWLIKGGEKKMILVLEGPDGHVTETKGMLEIASIIKTCLVLRIDLILGFGGFFFYLKRK
jgi:hypothetical protein